MANTHNGVFVACKNGDISCAKLISETDKSWLIEIEKKQRSISKADKRTTVFKLMSDALKWNCNDQALIDHFVTLDAAEQNHLTAT